MSAPITKPAPTPTAPITRALGLAISPRVLPTVDDLRAALAVVNAGDARGAAGLTLQAVVLARYAHHATGAARATSDAGVRFITSEDRKDIGLVMWNEAGYGTAPASDSRTPGDRSLASYVAAFGTVAQNMAYGVDALATVARATSAYKKINSDSATTKAGAAKRALITWEGTLSQVDAEHMARAFELLTEREHGALVSATWAAKVAAQVKADKS